MEGFFLSGSKMTLWMLIYHLAVFVGLMFLGILCQLLRLIKAWVKNDFRLHTDRPLAGK